LGRTNSNGILRRLDPAHCGIVSVSLLAGFPQCGHVVFIHSSCFANGDSPSGFLTGLSVADAKKKVIDYLEESKIGSKKVNFKLRDWVFLEVLMVNLFHLMEPIHSLRNIPLELVLPNIFDVKIPTLRKTSKKRNRYNATMGRIILVFLKIYGST